MKGELPTQLVGLRKTIQPMSVTLSNITLHNLKNYAEMHNQNVDETADLIIRKYLEHQDFYEKPRKTFSSYVCPNKIKIYRCLAIASANLGQISRKTHLSYATIKAHLEDLAFVGIVTEKRYGKRIRFFMLNRENPLTDQILTMLHLWYDP